MKPLRVLVADPSAYLASLTGGMLRTIGVQTVVAVTDSAAMLLALHRERFHVLVLDAELAPVDGIELTRQIRAQDSAASTMPIVMVFAEAERGRIEAARDAGATEIIRKPLSAKILEMRITQAIDNPRPFVRADAYAGPDRRRRTAEPAGKDRRSKADGSPPPDPEKAA